MNLMTHTHCEVLRLLWAVGENYLTENLNLCGLDKVRTIAHFVFVTQQHTSLLRPLAIVPGWRRKSRKQVAEYLWIGAYKSL